MTTVMPQRTVTTDPLVGPPPSELRSGNGARRRAERAVVRRALGYVDGVELIEPLLINRTYQTVEMDQQI